MSIEKNWWQNVNAALDLLRESVDDATGVLQKAGGREMAQGNLILARKVLAYCDKVDGFMMQIEKVGETWDGIKAIFDGEAPDVKKTMSEIKTRKRSVTRKPGYTRKVDKIAPWSNFTAAMENGDIISEPTAKEGFAKAFSHFNLDKCAALRIQLNGEPLLSKDKKAFKKYPVAVASVKDGWFINTYCSTAMKVSIIRQCASAVGQKVAINVIPHESTRKHDVLVKRRNALSPAPSDVKASKKFPFRVGETAVALFKELMKRSLLSDKEIAFLLSTDSSPKYRTGGNAVLKIYSGNDNDRYLVTKGGKKYTRYYKHKLVPLVNKSNRYLLCNQFAPAGIDPVLALADSKGISKANLIELVRDDLATHGGQFQLTFDV